MRKVPSDTDVNPALIARGTPGFSGADLANLVNEAALFAARANKKSVDMEELHSLIDHFKSYTANDYHVEMHCLFYLYYCMLMTQLF